MNKAQIRRENAWMDQSGSKQTWSQEDKDKIYFVRRKA